MRHAVRHSPSRDTLWLARPALTLDPRSLGPLSRSTRVRTARAHARPALARPTVRPPSAHRHHALGRAALDGCAASAMRPRCGAALGAARPSERRGPRSSVTLGAAWPSAGRAAHGGADSEAARLLARNGWPMVRSGAAIGAERHGRRRDERPSAVRRGRRRGAARDPQLDAARPSARCGAALWKEGSRACRKRNEH